MTRKHLSTFALLVLSLFLTGCQKRWAEAAWQSSIGRQAASSIDDGAL